MSENKTIEQIDFSVGSTEGQVGSIESFLELEDSKEPEVSLSISPKEKDSSITSIIEDIGDEADNSKEEKGVSEADETTVEPKGKEPSPPKQEDKDVPTDVHLPKGSKVDFKTIVSKLVEAKVWDSIDGFETEEGEQVPFEDMDIDEDTFISIYKQQRQEEQEKLNKDKVSTEGISSFTKKLIEIDKLGGSVQEALETFQSKRNPIEELDLGKESDQVSALYMKYKNKGLEDTEVVRIIKGLKEEGLLEEKATEAVSEFNESYEADLERIKQEGLERRVKQKEALKKYRESLGTQLKGYDVSDSYRRKLLDIATKENSEGKFELDDLYFKKRNNPEEVAEIVLFLTDKDEYLRQKTEKILRDDKLKTMRTIRVVKRKGGNKTMDELDRKEDRNFVDLEDIL